MAVAQRLMLGLALAGTAFGAGYLVGGDVQDKSWLAKQAKAKAKAERDADAKYRAEAKRGDDAVAALIAAHNEAATNYRQFERTFRELRKRTPLVVPASGAVCAGVVDDAGPASAGLAGRADRAAPMLTAGAVWMWNTALAGADQPAGACGSADTSEAACSAAAGVTLDEAWDNHAENARLCAEDRRNHQRLIDFLKAREP